jgi:hypothetical protein
VYNGQGRDLKTGEPHGPWLSYREGAGCFFTPNSTLRCEFDVYADAARSNLIGTGSIFTDEFSTAPSGFPNIAYLGGSLTVNTNIPNSPYDTSDPQYVNFRSITNGRIFYPLARQHPPNTSQPPESNVIHYESDGTALIKLWGSDGWNGSTWDPATRHTALDIFLRVTCPTIPPIEPTCPPCTDNRGNFIASTGTTAASYHSPSNCVTLSFGNNASPNGL